MTETQPHGAVESALGRAKQHHRQALRQVGVYAAYLTACDDRAVLAGEVERLRAVMYAAERVYYCYYNDAVTAHLRTNYTSAFLDSIMSLRTALDQYRDDTAAPLDGDGERN
jgi:hypothetical protein